MSAVDDARRPVRGRFAPPGDKSLSHRALILAALAGGRAELAGLNPGADVESTARALTALGARVARRGDRWTVESDGIDGLRAPRGPIASANGNDST